MNVNAMEGLMRAVRGGLSDDAKAKLRAVGLEVDGPFRPAGYTFEEWAKATILCRELAFPQLGPSEGALALGRRFVSGYFETLAGKALLGLIKLLGPQRAMERTPDNLRSGNASVEATVKKLGPSEYEVYVSYVLPQPEFTQGLMEEGARRAGARGIRSRILRTEGPAAWFHYAWD